MMSTDRHASGQEGAAVPLLLPRCHPPPTEAELTFVRARARLAARAYFEAERACLAPRRPDDEPLSLQ